MFSKSRIIQIEYSASETVPVHRISPDDPEFEALSCAVSFSAHLTYRFSVGFRSGGQDGHGRNLSLWSVNRFFNLFGHMLQITVPQEDLFSFVCLLNMWLFLMLFNGSYKALCDFCL